MALQRAQALGKRWPGALGGSGRCPGACDSLCTGELAWWRSAMASRARIRGCPPPARRAPRAGTPARRTLRSSAVHASRTSHRAGQPDPPVPSSSDPASGACVGRRQQYAARGVQEAGRDCAQGERRGGEGCRGGPGRSPALGGLLWPGRRPPGSPDRAWGLGRAAPARGRRPKRRAGCRQGGGGGGDRAALPPVNVCALIADPCPRWWP